MASFYFIPIVLVPWGRFSLYNTPVRPFLAFRDQISILIVGCVITKFASYILDKRGDFIQIFYIFVDVVTNPGSCHS
jgi:hypothetical protein